MSDEPLVECPACGKNGLERIVSGGAGVIYKGEGWYVTDYSKKSSGGKEESSKPIPKTNKPEHFASSSKTQPKPETESKPAEKPVIKPKADTSSSSKE